MSRSEPTRGEEPIELSIVMPCLNEAETIATCIKKARGFLEEHDIRGEIVIGDNGSTDGSQQIAEELGARVIDIPLRGYGAALYHATKEVRGTYVIMGDSDDSYDFSRLEPFVERLRAGDDLVMGNRFLGGIAPGAMPFKNRYLGNPVLTAIGRLFFNCPSKDFHCGLRGFRKDAFDKMDLRTTGMEYASEMVIKSNLLGLKISEVPTTLSKDGRSRPPHLRPWRDGWRHLRFMFLYSPRWLFLYPGVLAMVLGGLLMVGLWDGPIEVAGVGLDVHTMLYAAALVLIGFHSMAFAMLTKVFATQEKLYPESNNYHRIFQWFTLERGLIAGILLVLTGLAGSIWAVHNWSEAGFGGLEPREVLRVVVPSVLALTLGFQTILTSFFFSVLGLKVRRLEIDQEPATAAEPQEAAPSRSVA